MLKKLNPVSFKYKDFSRFGSRTHFGFIAQELLDVEPNLISQHENLLLVNMEEIIPHLVCSVQDLNSRVEQKKIEYDQTSAKMAAETLIVGSLTICSPNFVNIRGTVRFGPSGFEPYYADGVDFPNTVQILDAERIKNVNPILCNGKPQLIAQQVQQYIPEAVYEYNGKLCIDMDILLIMMISFIKKI